MKKTYISIVIVPYLIHRVNEKCVASNEKPNACFGYQPFEDIVFVYVGVVIYYGLTARL